MTVSLSMLAGAGAQFSDDNGAPLAGGLLYTYTAGTTTPAVTYQTSSGSGGSSNSNPIVLDSAGRVPYQIWLTDGVSYKFVLKTSAGATIRTEDNLYGGSSIIALSGSAGSSYVGFIQSGTGAVAETLQTKNRKILSLTDFSSSADYDTARAALSGDYNDMQVKPDIDNVATLLSEQLNHVRTQKPAAYSLPRFMRTIQNYRHDLQPAINIVGFGSSVGVGATLPNPATQAPVAYFTTRLKATLDPGTLYNIQVSNQCVNGSTISESIARLATVLALPLVPNLCVLAYGMNDAQVAIYNAGQTYPAVYTAALQFVRNARAVGSDVVLMTTPHHKTASGATLYTMPNGIAQSYPTAVAANVPPESLQPPASTSNVTADFLGTGVNLTASHRHLRVNQAMRQAATDAGVPLIDVERYWFKAVAKYGEAALFDSGETVHPNLLGHQNSYWLAIDEFLEGIGWQTSQEGQEPRLNGLCGVNADLPVASLDVYPAYPDTTNPPFQVSARIGLLDGGGVKANAKVFKIDPSNGDVVLYGAKSTDSASIEFFRRHFILDGTGTLISKVTDATTILSGMVNTVTHYGEYNKSIATITVFTVPDNAMGRFEINAYNAGIGRQRVRIEWVSVAGAITISGIATVGAAVITGPTTSGLNIQVTIVANNTNYMARLESATGV